MNPPAPPVPQFKPAPPTPAAPPGAKPPAPKKKFDVKTAVLSLFVLVLMAGIGFGLYLNSQPQTTNNQAAVAPNVARVANKIPAAGNTVESGLVEAEIRASNENFDEATGKYTTTFTITKSPRHDTNQEIQLLVAIERDRCPEGNGQPGSATRRYSAINIDDTFCFSPWEDDQYHLVTLNQGNNFSATVSGTVSQVNDVACGSFQVDLWVLSLNGSKNFFMQDSGDYMANTSCPLHRSAEFQFSYNGETYPDACFVTEWGLYKTGKDVGSAACQGPTATPTPTGTDQTPTPSPTQTVTNTPTPTSTNTPTPTTTLTVTPSPTSFNTPAPQGCGYTPCSDSAPCGQGLTCVTADNSGKYCARPDYVPACKANPGVSTCCYAPTAGPSATPTSGPSATPTERVLANVTNTPGPSATAAPTAIPAAGTPVQWIIVAVPLILVAMGLLL